MRRLKKLLKARFPQLYCSCQNALRYRRDVTAQLYFSGQNALRNRRHVTAKRRFLVVKHSQFPLYYDVLLDWLEGKFPELRALFELRLLPCRVRDWSRYVLHVPWLPDPVQHWSPRACSQAMRLADECEAHGVPIINRVDRLTNACKSTAAQRLAGAGLRTARMVRIEDIAEFRNSYAGMNFPLIIREDWGHGEMMLRAAGPEDLRKIPLEDFVRPLAVEFIDTSGERDGLFRKYRYLAAGEDGVAMHLHISREWITRGTNCENAEALFREEADYINAPHPHHELFQRARRALELDFVAFDYAYDRAGRVIVWEANPLPFIHFPRANGNRSYRKPAVERTLAAMMNLYLSRAGLPTPQPILDLVAVAGRVR